MVWNVSVFENHKKYCVQSVDISDGADTLFLEYIYRSRVLTCDNTCCGFVLLDCGVNITGKILFAFIRHLSNYLSGSVHGW